MVNDCKRLFRFLSHDFIQVTPHKMSVIVLIQEYCSLKKVETPTLSSSNESSLEIKFTEKEKRNFMITILQLLQVSSYPKMST